MDDTRDQPPGMRFFRDMDLITNLRSQGDPLSLEAAEVIEWLRTEMIDPAEYMRVSNERVNLLTEIEELRLRKWLPIVRDADNRAWAHQVAEWCARELEASRQTGNLDTRPFVQNADLIIAALREYGEGRNG